MNFDSIKDIIFAMTKWHFENFRKKFDTKFRYMPIIFNNPIYSIKRQMNTFSKKDHFFGKLNK